ncbi:MAG TPA: hypothetical protein VFJ77_08320 [Gaiellaceae bacterium]|nr:hypothetical protein [Gaiellaceae bacterium]
MSGTSEETEAPRFVEIERTEPGHRHAAAHFDLLMFIGWLAATVATVDGVEELSTIEEVYEPPAELDLERYKTLDAFLSYRQLLFEMIVERQVDNYLNYLAELLALIFKERPETLRRRPEKGQESDSVSLDEILKYESMDDLFAAVVERKVRNLSHESVDALARYLKGLGFELFPDDGDSTFVVFAVETRNAIAHTRGIVTRRFVERVPGFDLAPGDRTTFALKTVDTLQGALNHSVEDIDRRAAEKWGLPRTTRRYPPGG